MISPVLEIKDLGLVIGQHPILKNINLSVRQGEIHGLVGESGSGKSMTALSIMQLLPRGAKLDGKIRFDGHDLVTASEHTLCALRGDDIGMVFQEPMTALNPVKTIGEQVAEGIRFHTGASRNEAEARAASMLERVGLPTETFPLSRYPHELSGGQRQRVVIAIACALSPKLLIADEPTTSLDVVLQAQILDLLKTLVKEEGMGLILITHDLGIVADCADQITILRKGEVKEAGDAVTVLSRQAHPYTKELAQASIHVPVWKKRATPAGTDPLLNVDGVSRKFRRSRARLFGAVGEFTAVDAVSLSIPAGRSMGLVGRSGCGKSTLARMILALDKPSSGKITLDGYELTAASDEQLRAARRNMQVVFQDPYGSFDPRQRVKSLIAEPLHLVDSHMGRSERDDRVADALHEVAMPEDAMHRYPHEFSGGERQRLAIARAIITRPKLVVCDEPVSALDVSIRAQILDLFAKLNDELDLAYLFITHDLTVARAITHETLVMEAGRIVERAPTDTLLDDPQTEAARALVAAAPDLQRALTRRIS